MKRLILYLLLTFVSAVAICNPVEPVSGLKYLDEGRFDSIIRRSAGSDIPATYFVCTINTAVSPYTNANAIIKEYNGIRDFHLCPHLIFIVNNAGGVQQKDIEWYFKEVFYIDLAKDTNVMVVFDDHAYEKINFGNLTSDALAKIYYVHNSLLLHQGIAKLDDISQVKLPYDRVKIEFVAKVPINSDSLRVSTIDYLEPYDDNTLLYISDVRNDLALLDIKTGKFIRTFDHSQIDGVEYYCENIAATKSDCRYARNHSKTLLSMNRQDIYFYMAYRLKDTIIAIASLQVFEPLKEDFVYQDEEGKKQVIKAGSLLANDYALIFKCDENLNMLEVVLEDSRNTFETTKEQKLLAAGVDCGIYIEEDKILTPVTLWEGKFAGKNRNAFVYLKREADKYVFDSYATPLFPKDWEYLSWEYATSFIMPFAGKTIGIIDLIGGVYDLDQEDPVATFSGDGTPLRKKQLEPGFPGDDDGIYVNYYVLEAGTVINEKYLVAVYDYVYENNRYLEVKDQNFNTVQFLDFNSVPEFDKIKDDTDGSIISIKNDHLYFTYYENDTYYLNTYRFVEN